MRNKKGFLLGEETLKIILALVAIGFLIYFLVSLYLANSKSKDLELAEASLEHLIEEINSKNSEIEIYNPEGWWIISWPYEGIIPNSCSNVGWENCVCIYRGESGIGKFFKNLGSRMGLSKDEKERLAIIVDDEERALCLESDFSFETNPTKIQNPPLTLNIEYNEEIIITR